MITYRDMRGKKKISDFLKFLRNAFIEFGPAEYFDSFLIRPFFLAVTPLVVSNYSAAILIGTIPPNLLYYFFTILGYESRKNLFKD